MIQDRKVHQWKNTIFTHEKEVQGYSVYIKVIATDVPKEVLKEFGMLSDVKRLFIGWTCNIKGSNYSDKIYVYASVSEFLSKDWVQIREETMELLFASAEEKIIKVLK